MRCLFCYYSGSGNTKLACDYIGGRIKNVEFDFFNILKKNPVDFDGYDVVGFATWADYWGPSPVFKTFVRSLPAIGGKPAFVFNTFGMLSGATLRIMRDLATQKGFRVIDGHSLHMPENIATMIVAGMGNEQAPSPKEMGAFDGFISRLAGRLSSPETLSCAKRFNVPLPIRLLPAMPRFIGKREMGSKFVDDALCTHCGLCRTKCPYGAITMAASPVFDEKKCMTCWACFNHCPMRAIYTKKVRGKGHYPSPIAAVQEKLKA